jgi:hypothetical protein
MDLGPVLGPFLKATLLIKLNRIGYPLLQLLEV